MASVALTGRIHERTRPESKVLLKSLASAGPSIHEAFDEGILRRLAGRDVMPVDTALVGPCQDGVAGQFDAVVADHHFGLAALDDQPVQLPRHLVKDRYPPYIAWQSYEKIRGIVSDNRAEYMRNKTRGAPREGELLLQGIAWCGRCGHKMYARYKGGAEYVCNHLHSHQGLPACQYIRARRVDAAVAQAFLTALAPAEIRRIVVRSSRSATGVQSNAERCRAAARTPAL